MLADQLVLAEGAALLGQGAERAAIEMAGMGGEFQADVDLRIALTGAPMRASIDGATAAWDIPRQSQLTSRIPEGALAVAIRQLVLFSVATPTGWMHAGQTAVRLFRPDAEEPFLLRPGDEVQFTSVTPEELQGLRRDPLGGAKAEDLS